MTRSTSEEDKLDLLDTKSKPSGCWASCPSLVPSVLNKTPADTTEFATHPWLDMIIIGRLYLPFLPKEQGASSIML